MDALLIEIVINTLFSGSMLWIAAKITHEDLAFFEAAIVALVSSLTLFVPFVGWVLSILVFFYLLKKYTRADIWPDLILLVLVSKLVGFIGVLVLADLL